MAVIPDIDVSTRRLETAPALRFAPSNRGALIREAGGAVTDAANALDRIAEVQLRADYREAENAVMKATDFVKNGWNGYDTRDGQTGQWSHVPGVADRTWREMRADGTNPLDESRRLCRAVRDQEFYKALSARQRKAFERKWLFHENAFMRSAQQRNMALRQQRVEDETKENVAWRGERVGECYGDDAKFDRAAKWAATRNYADMLGTAITNPEVFDDPELDFATAEAKGLIKWRGGKLSDEERERKLREYRRTRAAFVVNRITALHRAAANGMGIGEYAGADAVNKAEYLTNCLVEAGEINEEQANRIFAEGEKALKSYEGLRDESRTRAYKEELASIGEIELALSDPKKVDETGRGLNYEAFCEDLAKRRPDLTKAQSVSLRGEYRKLCAYNEKRQADLKKFNEKQIAAENAAAAADRAQHGYVNEDGAFVPASAFPKESDPKANDEFDDANGVWQNPRTAMAKLEAARMTGRLSKADYNRHYAYGKMMMDEAAQKWWLAHYGQFDFKGLMKTKYGETDVERDIAQKRTKETYGRAASGIFAARRGTGKAYMGAADFVADTLELDAREGSEELVPYDVLPKVYDTVRRLARAGVDPSDAVRAILQPAIQAGIDRDLNARLSDPDYFRKVVEDFRQTGTHFYGDFVGEGARMRPTNYYDDLSRAVTDARLKQGRATLAPAATTGAGTAKPAEPPKPAAVETKPTPIAEPVDAPTDEPEAEPETDLDEIPEEKPAGKKKGKTDDGGVGEGLDTPETRRMLKGLLG